MSEEDMPVLDGPPDFGGPRTDSYSYSSDHSTDEEFLRFKKMAKAMAEADLDGNGEIDKHELQLIKNKLKTQRIIAVAAFILISFLGVYIAIWMPLERIEQVSTALDLLWVTLGGVIATYMGAEAYVSRRE